MGNREGDNVMTEVNSMYHAAKLANPVFLSHSRAKNWETR